MKKLSLALILISCTALTACNNGQKINAHNEKTAFKSVRTIKNRLNEEMRLSYELSFWMIRDFKRNDDEFLKAVDGKIPTEIIALGKDIYQQRKESGAAEYQKYKSWEEMIAKFDKERLSQGRPQSDINEKVKDPRVSNRDVDYKL